MGLNMININNEFEVGEEVFDEVTGKEAIVIGISFARGCVGNLYIDQSDNLGYWLKLDKDDFDGARFPWELLKIKKLNE